jgi:hypothetical protein
MTQVQSSVSSLRFRASRVGFAVTLAMFGAGLPAQARQAKIIDFDPPGSSQTVPMGINESRSITGVYADTQGELHGFLRTRDGAITTIDAPGAACGGTGAQSINRSGTIVGSYSDGVDGPCCGIDVPG